MKGKHSTNTRKCLSDFTRNDNIAKNTKPRQRNVYLSVLNIIFPLSTPYK